MSNDIDTTTPRLQGKVALVTGASRGQGEAEARLFAAHGAQVIVADVLDKEGDAVAKDIGERAEYMRLDVSDESQWQQVVGAIEQKHGKLNVLVNNAGILDFGAIFETKLEAFQKVIAVNQVGTFLGIKVAGAAMERAGGGSIVNISSTGGLVGVPQSIAYTASKFAVRGMTKTAAMDLGQFNIRVNSIHPGCVDTAMTRGDPLSGASMDATCAKLPIPRAGQPIDIARMALYLASDESAYSTGSEFIVDGGLTAGDAFDD